MVCTVCHFTLFKNWLKHIFVLTACMWEAAPCRTLPTADENAVTESAVTTVSSSLFQSATVLTKNEFLYCSVLLSEILKPQELRISCLAMVWSESQSQLKTCRFYLLTRAKKRSAAKSDENATTESAVTTLSSSLFQSATVLTKNQFLCSSVDDDEVMLNVLGCRLTY